MVSHLTVLRDVGLIVRIEEIEVGTAHGDLPDTGGDVTPRESHYSCEPVAILVHDRRSRDAEEVLGVVLGYLVALG